MGLGSTAKKLQTVADLAEKLYSKVNDIRERVVSMQESVGTTEARVERLERDLADQRAILDALAAAEGVDVDAVLDDLDRGAADGDDATADTEDAAAGDATAGDGAAGGAAASDGPAGDADDPSDDA